MPTARQAYIQRAHKRRVAAANFQKFAADIASPFVATVTPYTMPASGRIGVSFSALTTAGQISVSIGAREMNTPALAANQIYRLDVIDRAKEIVLDCAIAGTVTLYVFNEWMQPFAIATAVV
jgi:hypothetical protein